MSARLKSNNLWIGGDEKPTSLRFPQVGLHFANTSAHILFKLMSYGNETGYISNFRK